jgi:hypothetical protein
VTEEERQRLTGRLDLGERVIPRADCEAFVVTVDPVIRDERGDFAGVLVRGCLGELGDGDLFDRDAGGRAVGGAALGERGYLGMAGRCERRVEYRLEPLVGGF